MKVAILGCGGFGTAMAIALARAGVGHEVRMWGHDREHTRQLAEQRTNQRYLDGVEVPAAVLVTTEPEPVLRAADVALVAVPTQHVRSVIDGMLALLPATLPLVSLSKGLEQTTGKRPSQVLAELCGGERRVLVLSGPSHAEEIARGMPTTVVLAGEDDALVQRLQENLSTPLLRIYRNLDICGTELGGALKNVMAIAAGIADGLGFGDNAKAAILSRGVVEMARYGVAAGADERTFFGLAGLGDLAVTAFSRHGRNRALGERIGRGEPLTTALAATPKIAEGVWTAKVVVERAKAMGVEMPIATAVFRVLFGGLSPLDAVRGLMDRDVKAEG